MFAVFIFEVGSLVCGVAPSIYVLILGRAIAGVGAAGIFCKLTLYPLLPRFMCKANLQPVP